MMKISPTKMMPTTAESQSKAVISRGETETKQHSQLLILDKDERKQFTLWEINTSLHTLYFKNDFIY